MRITIAFKAFFAALFNRQAAQRIANSLDANQTPRLADKTSTPDKPAVTSTEAKASVESPTAVASKKSARSEALTLLSTLQREARFVDLVMEPLDGYSDEQVGAAARDVLRDSAKVLNRFFAIKPLVEQTEGETISLPESPNPVRWRMSSSGSGAAPQQSGSRSSGVLVHPGWTALQSNLPTWEGKTEDALVIAPAEVEAAR